MAREKVFLGHRMPPPRGETWVSRAERTQETNRLLGDLAETLNRRGMDGDLWVNAYVRPGIEKLERRAYQEEGCYLKDTALGFTALISRLGSLYPLRGGGKEDLDQGALAEEISDKAMADFGKILEDCGCRYDERA